MQLVDDCSFGFRVVGYVVVLQQVRATAINTYPVSFFHDPALSGGWVSLPRRCIDRSAFSIVDQRPNERLLDDLGHGGSGDRGAIVERCAVTTNVKHNFCLHI